ncbi:MAG: ornithine cyclodeaminase family protein, partial [Alphaproteobacteria bacterium]
DKAKARALAERLSGGSFVARAADDLEAAMRAADIVSCATLSKEPLVRGDWLRPGQHVDLVGSYARDMRESDDAAVARARVHVDTPAALLESGDLVMPIASGALREDAIAGTLADLARGAAPGRRADDEITLFKSTGTALEDLAGAVVVYEGAPR